MIKTVEGVYDPTNLQHPIKYTIRDLRGNSILLQGWNGYYYSVSFNKYIDFNRNGQNGEAVTIYFATTKFNRRLEFVDYFWAYPTYVVFEVSDYFKVYESFRQLDIIPTPKNRNLEAQSDSLANVSDNQINGSTIPSEKNIMSSAYFVFFVIAQIGGLYSFLKMILGSIMDYLNQKCMNHSLINSVYSFKSDTSFDKNGHNEFGSSNSSNKVLPLDNPSNPKSKQKMFYPDIGIGRPVINPKIDNELNESYEGGNRVDHFPAHNLLDSDTDKVIYNNTDLMYSIFCCKGQARAMKKSKEGRNYKFNKELSIFNQQRDIVNFVVTLNNLKSKLSMIDSSIMDLQINFASLKQSK